MRKRYLPLLFLSIFMMGCSVVDPIGILPDPSVFQKEGHNITDFDFLNVPSEGIKRGYFDDYNIKLQVTYDDGSTYVIDLTLRKIPQEYRKLLNTVGTHTVEILFRGVSKTTTFKILPSDKKFTVNYYTYNGYRLTYFEVDPGEKITPPEVPFREEDDRMIYESQGWEEDLLDQEVYSDYDIYPLYNPIFKRNHFVTAFPKEGEIEAYTPVHRELYSYVDGEKTHTYVHLGRLNRAILLNEDHSMYHEQGTEEEKRTWTTPEAYEVVELQKQLLSTALSTTESGTHFDVGNEKTQLDNFFFNYTGYGDLDELLKGNTDTRFSENGAIVPLYRSYITEYYSWVCSFPETVEVTLPKDSSTGYYRLSAQGNVDIILEYISRATESGVELCDTKVLTLVDYDNIDYIFDYSATGSFASTKKYQFSSGDVYNDVMSYRGE